MKKNICINLYGTLYNIDDDAYALLDNYLKSMQRCFNQENGGEEVADDIEHRVAELLWQRKEAGSDTVSIEQVKEIIATIGKPEEIGGEEENTQGEEAETQAEDQKEGQKHRFFEASVDFYSKRKLYRDADDRMIAGVCAGLAAFFNFGSPTAWRIVTAIAALLLLGLGGSILFLLLGYLILWILVPKAVTPEDRLRMQGKDVTPENVAQQVMNDTRHVVLYAHSNKWGPRIIKAIFIILLVCLTVPAFIMLFTSVAAFITIGCPMMMAAMGLGDLQQWIYSVMPWVIVLLIGGLLLFVLPIVGILRAITDKHRTSKFSIVWGTVAWFIILALGIGCVVYLAFSFKVYDQNKKEDAALHLSLHNMQRAGWSLDESENLFPYFAHPSYGWKNDQQRCISLRAQHRNVNNGTYSVVFSKEEFLPENGTYTFIAVTQKSRANLTYTFRYTGGGEEKEVVLQPTLPGVKLNDDNYEEYAPYGFSFTFGSDYWNEFISECDDWQVHSIDVENVDAGTGMLTIAARQSKDRVKIFDVKVVKKE